MVYLVNGTLHRARNYRADSHFVFWTSILGHLARVMYVDSRGIPIFNLYF